MSRSAWMSGIFEDRSDGRPGDAASRFIAGLAEAKIENLGDWVDRTRQKARHRKALLRLARLLGFHEG